MKKNITRVDALNTAIDMITNTIELNGSGDPDEAKLTETVEVLTSIRDTISKANSRKSDKPTKTQVENAGIKAELLTHITAEGVRCGDLAAAVGISGQKASALLSQMVREGTCRKVEGAKRVTLFALPAEG